MANTFEYTWADSPPFGQTHFIRNLGLLYRIYLQNKNTTNDVCFFRKHMGKIAQKSSSDEYIEDLLVFVRKEHNSYGFSPISFSHVRFERHFKDKTHIMDFWLTCCVDVNMSGVLDDMFEAIKK